MASYPKISATKWRQVKTTKWYQSHSLGFLNSERGSQYRVIRVWNGASQWNLSCSWKGSTLWHPIWQPLAAKRPLKFSSRMEKLNVCLYFIVIKWQQMTFGYHIQQIPALWKVYGTMNYSLTYVYPKIQPFHFKVSAQNHTHRHYVK